MSNGMIDFFQNSFENLRLLANAFYYSGIGVALVSPTGHFLWVNRSLSEMLGYSPEELQKLSFQKITYTEDLQMDLDLLQNLLDNKQDTYQIEKRYRSKSGEIVWARLTVLAARDDDGPPKYFISQIEDISAAKSLQINLADQNRVLQSAMETLQLKLRQLDEINAVIGHNFRGSVANVKVLCDLYKHGNSGLGQEEIIAMIEECSDSMILSLDSLSELSAPALRAELQFEQCRFDEAYSRIESQLKGVISIKEACIATQWGIPEIEYPRAYLESIFYNLLSNALKYIRKDVPPVIIISTYLQDGRTVLSIKDNGLGIDLKKNEGRLFRLRETFHEGFDSKGVGLFITRSQVESLGGRITVMSEVGHGTQFLVMF